MKLRFSKTKYLKRIHFFYCSGTIEVYNPQLISHFSYPKVLAKNIYQSRKILKETKILFFKSLL